MHRTEGTNHVGNLFTDGPPGTAVEEDFLNAIQEEICNVVETSGLTLKTAATETRDQLLTALQALFIQKTNAIGKNAIINGDFRVSQRGASGSAIYTAASAPLNSDDTYLHDRWLLLSDGDNIVDVSQSTEAPTDGLLSCALDVETVNKKFGIFQPIEQKNCMHMVGEEVSLSFEAKVSDITKIDNIKAMVVSWDGAADIITSDIISAWNAEDTTPTLVANWTAENTASNLEVTAAWAKYTIPNISIDTASAKNIGVFIWSDGLCDTLVTFLYITKVQLELGAVSSEYEWRNITDELAMCQRYFCKSFSSDVAIGTGDVNGINDFFINGITNADHSIKFSVAFPIGMRSAPTVTIYDLIGTSGKATMAAGNNIDGVGEHISSTGFRFHATNGAVNVERFLQAHYSATIEL